MAARAQGVIEIGLDGAPPAGAAAGGAAAAVLARLAAREEARAASAAVRAAAAEGAADPRESVDAFMEEFGSRRQALEAAMAAAAAGGGASGSGAGDATAAAAAAATAGVAQQLEDLEKAVADAAYFLPAYDLRQATLALAALREQHEAAAAAAQPRRRFAFNRKASAKTAAAAAGDAAGGGAATAAAAAPEQAQQQAGAAGSAAAADTGTGGSSSSGTTICGLRGAVVAPTRADAEGKEWTLSDLEDCTIYLLAPLAVLYMHRLRRCRVYTGPVGSACFLEGAEGCTLMLAARQVRVHAARGCDAYLRVGSHPIIEDSSGMRFAPYCPAYSGADDDLEAAGLAADEAALWSQVSDFGWLRSTPSPHWAVLPAGERAAAPAGPDAQAAAAEGGAAAAAGGG